MAVSFNQLAGLKRFDPPPKYPDIELPERRRLTVLPKVPQYPPSLRPHKMQKKLRFMRGPEPHHTTFIHKQFGIVATGGGRLKQQHFEMVRMFFLRHLPFDKTVFAIWRVDAPWQPVTKKGQGQRMGGGKGPIDHYVTPVKAGRVIVEVGGHAEYQEVKKILENVAARLPFDAVATTHEQMMEDRKKEQWLEENNKNPWTFKYIIQNNLCGVNNWISPVDKLYFGKYR
ncbi:hypothetical protein HCN44_004056 [Aphidius gifuensis]|uniref:Large ribosomal subunit protein uL16m n=2 Tax=Aphidius gifuensis TaxID=684658 RepID=A0A834Y0C1_APHGI|nr:hypothetical protein HCN44_004056 [Aphidius gifuensis]